MPDSILVIRFSSLGDLVLASAPLINLRLAFPTDHITLLTRERFAWVAGRMTGTDDVITVPDSLSSAGLLKLTNELRERRFKMVIDLHGNFRAAWLRMLMNAERKVVYPKRTLERRRLVRSHKVPTAWPYTIDLYNSAIADAGGTILCHRPVLTAPSVLRAADPTVLIAPGASHSPKQYLPEQFAQVARLLMEKRRCRIIWATPDAAVGFPDETPVDRTFLTVLSGVPLAELAEAITRSHVVLANDSGVMHLASALGTPVLGLFGPTHPALGFAPRGQFDGVIEVDEHCRPCSLHGKKPCFREQQFCFTRILPEQVYDRASTLLDRVFDWTPALFVDRDGTLIEDCHYLSDPEQVRLIPGAVEGLRRATEAGYKIVIISNQSGMARGYFTRSQLDAVEQRVKSELASHGVAINGQYCCPHYPEGCVTAYARLCNCRKPAPGMLEQAADELGLDLRRSMVIGDKVDDIALQLTTGVRAVLVRTGHGREAEAEFAKRSWAVRVPVCDSISAAIATLVG